MEKKKRKKGRKEWRKGGRREAKPSLQTSEADQGAEPEGLSLGIPHNEPQEFSPGSRSPKYQVHPSGV